MTNVSLIAPKAMLSKKTFACNYENYGLRVRGTNGAGFLEYKQIKGTGHNAN